MRTKALVLVLALTLILFISGNTVAQEDKGMTYEEALACVQSSLPAESYMTNDYLPQVETLNRPSYENEASLRVGLAWIMNDEFTPLYIADALGYFDEVGLSVELVPGGPGTDHLLTLGSGVVDVAISAGGAAIPSAVTSETPIDLVAVGALLKGMPYAYLTVDEDLVDKELAPEDLVGKVVATQTGSELYLYMLLDKYGIDRDAVTIIEAGFSAESIMVGQSNFFSGWRNNQTRQLELAGLEWNLLPYNKWVYNENSDVIAVRAEMLETAEGQNIVRRFLWATYMGSQYMLDNPQLAADIAVEYSADVELTTEEAIWRYDAQEELVRGNTDRLLEMDPNEWNQVVATLLQYDQIQIDCEE